MSKEKDEYDEIYKQHEGSGFEFDYSKRHLGRSKIIFKEDAAKIDQSKRNNDKDPLFVCCGSCNVYMDFEVGINDDLDGHWICPSCGARVRERTIYYQLDRENADEVARNAMIDDDPEWM